MYPLDFEEFLYANGMNEFVISALRNKFNHLEELDESMHNKMMDLFKKYLLVGGMPDAINTYLSEKNIVSVEIFKLKFMNIMRQMPLNIV